MAAVVATNISTAVWAGGTTPRAYGDDGMIIEVWRSLGGTAGDTVTIVPTTIADIRSAVTNLNAGHALSTNAGNTQVVFTMGTGAQAASSYDYHIVGKRRT